MKLLLLSDLHSRQAWFDWIAAQSADAVLVAGDLVDGFSPVGILPQMVAVSEWAAKLRYPLAVCSGNHDANFPWEISPTELEGMDPCSSPLPLERRWMDTLDRPGVIVDGRSEIVEWGDQRVLVSTIPYSGFDDENLTDSLWDAGVRLRREHRLPWFVLHHEPPAGTAVGGTGGDSLLLWRILERQPDYVLSGHLHDQPYRSDGNFADRIGQTWCFNAGSPPSEVSSDAVWPNHILLDTCARTAEWQAHAADGNKEIKRSISLE